MASLRTAVVHLVWGPLGVAPFETFVSSYQRHDAGAEHELFFVFNGVDDPEPYRALATQVSAREIVLDQRHTDLGAYVAASDALEHRRMCFVNSYSEILVPGWLGLLEAALEEPEVGAAGATGSWASPLSYNLYQLGLRGPYSRAFTGRRAARIAFEELTGRSHRRLLSHWTHTLATTIRHGRGTGLFPACHLRTNAFLVDRVRFLALAAAPTKTKWDTYRLESGSRSITAQLSRAGTPPVVVDKAGVARRPDEWHLGDVLFQSAQEDLLVADNVTRRYASATPTQREVLSAFAWGAQARPSRS